MTNIIVIISVPDDDSPEGDRLPEDVVGEIVEQGLAATMRELEYQIYRQ